MGKKQTIRLLDEKSLRKKYPNAGLAIDFLLPHHLFLPSRCIPLNWQLGGGIPYGKIIEVMGYESTGKSLLAMDFCYAAQKLGGKVLWDDAEGSFDLYWAEKNGLSVNDIELYTDNDIEGFSDWARDMILYHRSKLVNNEPIVLVVDSIAAMECLENIDSDQNDGKSEMGKRAKVLYQFYRKRNSYFMKYGVIVIMINQVRDKVGAGLYEAAEQTPGGKSTRFYASQRLGLIRSRQIKGVMGKKGFREDIKGVKFGQNIILSVQKNKVAPPRSNVKTKVYFLDDIHGYVGYDRYEGLQEILLNLRVIKQKGSRYYYKGSLLCNGKDNLIPFLHDNPKIRAKLIKKTGINTISRLKETLASLGHNLYPVKLKKKSEE